MTEKCLKKCSTSLAIMEMNIKIPLIFHLTLVTMAKVNNTHDTVHSGEDVEQVENSFIAVGSTNLYSHYVNQHGGL